MSMNNEVKSVIENCAQASHDGLISFGEVVMKLMSVGVESYYVDYRLGQTIYYLPSGETHSVKLVTPEVAIADAFRVDGVQAAVRGAQSGVVKYQEFMQLTMSAGCVGYFVWITGRHVQYLGHRGEAHVEHFPS